MSPPPAPTALCVVPARFASTRFPGKPLASDTGKPLIQHVVENARRAARVDRVVVATDDARIFEAVRAFGGEAVMTHADHPNGTSRIAQAVTALGDEHELIVNVQGDEPEIDPAVIDRLIEGLAHDAGADMATLSADFAPGDDPANPNIVKLVIDRGGRALYFSRALIPHDRDAGFTNPKYLKHPGLYAYRRAFLLQYPTLEATPLEQAEQLEQLRVLEHGRQIAVIHATAPHPGIDTPDQYAAFVRRYRAAAR